MATVIEHLADGSTVELGDAHTFDDCMRLIDSTTCEVRAHCCGIAFTPRDYGRQPIHPWHGLAHHLREKHGEREPVKSMLDARLQVEFSRKPATFPVKSMPVAEIATAAVAEIKPTYADVEVNPTPTVKDETHAEEEA